MTTATKAGERKWPISGNLGKQSASHLRIPISPLNLLVKGYVALIKRCTMHRTKCN